MSAAAPLASAPFLASVLVLGGAGVAKAVRPDDTARALRAAGLPAHRLAVRAGAVAEVLVAAAALVVPGLVTGVLVALSYAAFAAFVSAALARGWTLSSCGCFGRADSRPTYAHVAVDLGAGVAAGSWAADRVPSLPGLLAAQPWHGAALLLEVVVLTGLAYAVMTNPMAREVAAP